MNKIFINVLLIFSLTSCFNIESSELNSQSTTTDSEIKENSNDSNKLTFDLRILASKDEAKIINSVIYNYNESFSEDYNINVIINSMKVNELGAEFITNHQNYDLIFLPDDYLKECTSLIDPIESSYAQTLENDFINPLMSLRIENNLYSYPAYIESGYIAFYNNKYIFENENKSLESILEIAQEKKKTVQIPFDNSWMLPMFLSTTNPNMINHINYSYVDNSIKYDCNWDNNENLKICLYLKDLFEKYIDAGVLEPIRSESVIEGFYKDDLLAVIGLPIHYNTLFIEEELTNIIPSKLPEFYIDNNKYEMGSFVSSKSYYVSSSSNNKKISHEFASFMTSDEVQKTRYDINKNIPSSQSLLTSEDFISKLEDVEKAYVKQAFYSINQSIQIENSFYEIMNDVYCSLFDNSFLSNKTISDLLIESVALLNK